MVAIENSPYSTIDYSSTTSTPNSEYGIPYIQWQSAGLFLGFEMSWKLFDFPVLK